MQIASFMLGKMTVKWLVLQLATAIILALICDLIDGQTVENDCTTVQHHYINANASNNQYIMLKTCTNCFSTDHDILSVEVLTLNLTPIDFHNVIPYWNKQLTQHVILKIPPSSFFTTDISESHDDINAKISYKCKEHRAPNTKNITINLKALRVELFVNSSYSETVHECQSMVLDCVISGLHKNNENTHIRVHHYDGSSMNMSCNYSETSANKDQRTCRSIISPCNKANSGMYSCTIKVDGKEFSSTTQNVQVDSDKMELIKILGSSIGALLLVAILTLVIINSVGCIYIRFYRRPAAAGRQQPPPLPPVPGHGPGPQPQAQNGHAQSGQHAISLRRAPSSQQPRRRSIEQEPLLGDERGIAGNQTSFNSHRYGGVVNKVKESAADKGNGQKSCGEDKGDSSGRASPASIVSSGHTHGSRESRPGNVSLEHQRSSYETQV